VGVYGLHGKIFFDQLNIYTSRLDGKEKKVYLYWPKDPNAKIVEIPQIACLLKPKKRII